MRRRGPHAYHLPLAALAVCGLMQDVHTSRLDNGVTLHVAPGHTAPVVDPDELAREREVILEEIRQGTDDPARSVAQSLFATAFVAHPYRRPVIGTATSVRGLGERELIEFFRGYYVADNLTLVVAG